MSLMSRSCYIDPRPGFHVTVSAPADATPADMAAALREAADRIDSPQAVPCRTYVFDDTPPPVEVVGHEWPVVLPGATLSAEGGRYRIRDRDGTIHEYETGPKARTWRDDPPML